MWTSLRVTSTELNISIIEEAFADCAVPTPPGHTPLLLPGSIPGCWADVCGFLKRLGSDQYWKVRLHGAFSIPHEALGLRPTDQSCHTRDITPPRIRRLAQRSITSRRTRSTNSLERTSCAVPLRPAERRISDIMSDHSLSSDIATIRTRLTVLCGTCTSSPSVKTTPQRTLFPDVKYAGIWEQIELTMTGQSRTTTSRRKELCTWNCVYVVKLS